MRKILKLLKWLSFSIFVIFILAIVYLRFSRFSDELIYKTNKGTYAQFDSKLDFDEFYFDVGDAVELHAALFKPDSLENVATIFHYSGKGMNLMSSIQKLYDPLLKKGFQIFCFERRGFGKSSGEANNSKILKEDALKVFDQFLELEDVADKPLIVWGQSLGGAFATMTAKERQETIDGLILEGTFSSFPDIGKVYAKALNLENFKWLIPLIMNNDFPAIEEIKAIEIPTTIIHSTIDKQVPYELGRKLYEASNKENTKFWDIDSKHIKGMLDYEEEYVNTFLEILME